MKAKIVDFLHPEVCAGTSGKYDKKFGLIFESQCNCDDDDLREWLLIKRIGNTAWFICTNCNKLIVVHCLFETFSLKQDIKIEDHKELYDNLGRILVKESVRLKREGGQKVNITKEQAAALSFLPPTSLNQFKQDLGIADTAVCECCGRPNAHPHKLSVFIYPTIIELTIYLCDSVCKQVLHHGEKFFYCPICSYVGWMENEVFMRRARNLGAYFYNRPNYRLIERADFIHVDFCQTCMNRASRDFMTRVNKLHKGWDHIECDNKELIHRGSIF